MDAIKMSCAFPIIFSPKIISGFSQKATILTEINENVEDKAKYVEKEVDKRIYCFIDGGVMCNYPVNVCMEDQKCEPDEILGFRNIWEKYNETIDDDSSLIDFLKICVKQMIRKIENENSYIKIKNEVSCVSETTDYTSWFDLCSDESKRIHYIQRGMTYGEVFLRLITKI
jgi:predicted acylesterase/phospholipase RssA